MVQTMSVSRIYVLRPLHAGNLIVPAGFAKDEAGHTYQSNTLTIQVVPGNVLQRRQPQQQQSDPWGDDPFANDPMMQQLRQQQIAMQQRMMQQQRQAQGIAATAARPPATTGTAGANHQSQSWKRSFH